MRRRFFQKASAMCLSVLLGVGSMGTSAFASETALGVKPAAVADDLQVQTIDNLSEGDTDVSEDEALKILMVGNSLTRYNDVAGKLVELFTCAGEKVVVDTRTQMGASLFDQADILAASTREAIVDGDYDYVVLQEKSSGFTEALLKQGVEAFAPWIEEAPSKPQLVLYMPWANEDVFKSMQTSFTNAYVNVAKEHDALLAPSGEAYYDLYFNEGLEWYREGDNVHGNDLASLVSASTIFYTITGEEQPLLQFGENAEDRAAVKALVESSDYRNNRVDYDRFSVNIIEEKAYEYTNLYRDLNHVPDLTGRGVDETVNLAKSKQGWASSNARGSSAGVGARTVGNLTDGSYTSYIVLHQDDPEPWYAVDFGEKTEFNQLTLYWGGSGNYEDSSKAAFVVEGSNDEDATTNAEAIFEEITSGESVGTEAMVVTFPAVKYRYVRVRVTDVVGAYTSMFELEVYNADSDSDEDNGTDEPEVKVFAGDYLQVKVGAELTDMSLYELGMYEANVVFPANVNTYEILSNGEAIYKGKVTEAGAEQDVIIRYFAKEDKVKTGQDVHEDQNGNPVQDIKKVANWTGNFFKRTGIEEFKEFGGWDQSNAFSTLNYLGGGIFSREFLYTVPEEAVTYQYKINFDKVWANGEVPSENREVKFPVSDQETDTFILWVNSERGELYDSINDGDTTFRIEGNDSYSKTIGAAKVELVLKNGDNEVAYSMVQTGLEAYMVTAFIEPGTYVWSDRIDDQKGTLNGEFTVGKDSAVTFFYHVDAEDYVMLNTVDDAEGFYNATVPGTVDVTPIENPFEDVEEDDWFYQYVMFAYANGLMGGKGTTDEGNLKFDPDNVITRAEFVQMLYSKEEKPEVEYTDTFADVAEGQWYTNAILWAAKNNIAGGKKADYFDVNGNITRQELAVIMYQYASFKGYDVTTEAQTEFIGFADAQKVSEWAKNGMLWAVGYDIISGKTEDGEKVLSPNGNAIRAEAATMMKAFMVAYEGAEK